MNVDYHVRVTKFCRDLTDKMHGYEEACLLLAIMLFSVYIVPRYIYSNNVVQCSMKNSMVLCSRRIQSAGPLRPFVASL